jgi:hypothetical protein
MIKFVILAIVIIFISWCMGALAGHSAGYHQAWQEMLPILSKLEKIVNKIVKDWSDRDGTLRPSEEGDRKTP